MGVGAGARECIATMRQPICPFLNRTPDGAHRVVLGMLQVDPSRRMSAADVLRDPWIRAASKMPDVSFGSV